MKEDRSGEVGEDTTMKTTAKILVFLMLLLNPAAVEKVDGLTMGNPLLRAKIAIANKNGRYSQSKKGVNEIRKMAQMMKSRLQLRMIKYV